MTAWSLPLVLTILVMATNNVDGSAVSGICYVGYSSRTARAMFVLVPHTISLLVAAFFTWRCVTLLASLCHGPGSEHLSTAALSKLRSTLTRISVFSVMVAACVFCTLACHIYRWVNEDSWDAALHKLVLCNLNKQLSPEQSSKCSMDDRPSLGMVQLELLAFSATGVLAASWVCTKESFNTWVIGIRQLVCRLPSQRPVKLRKHEIIAQVTLLSLVICITTDSSGLFKAQRAASARKVESQLPVSSRRSAWDGLGPGSGDQWGLQLRLGSCFAAPGHQEAWALWSSRARLGKKSEY